MKKGDVIFVATPALVIGVAIGMLITANTEPAPREPEYSYIDTVQTTTVHDELIARMEAQIAKMDSSIAMTKRESARVEAEIRAMKEPFPLVPIIADIPWSYPEDTTRAIILSPQDSHRIIYLKEDTADSHLIRLP